MSLPRSRTVVTPSARSSSSSSSGGVQPCMSHSPGSTVFPFASMTSTARRSAIFARTSLHRDRRRSRSSCRRASSPSPDRRGARGRWRGRFAGLCVAFFSAACSPRRARAAHCSGEEASAWRRSIPSRRFELPRRSSVAEHVPVVVEPLDRRRETEAAPPPADDVNRLGAVRERRLDHTLGVRAAAGEQGDRSVGAGAGARAAEGDLGEVERGVHGDVEGARCVAVIDRRRPGAARTVAGGGLVRVRVEVVGAG